MEINKIICGDCLEVMKEIPDKNMDITFTSPPYNRKRNDKYLFYNDIIDDYYSFMKTFIDEAIRVTKGNVFINLQKNYYNKKDVFRLIGNFYKEIYEIFIWEKSNPMPARGFNITNAYEFIICFGNKLKSNNTYTKNHLTTSVTKMSKEHKAIMHNDVAEFFIINFTNKNDIVFDPFIGIGTTAKIAIKNNRKYFGIDISPEYCEIARRRIRAIPELLFV